MGYVMGLAVPIVFSFCVKTSDQEMSLEYGGKHRCVITENEKSRTCFKCEVKR